MDQSNDIFITAAWKSTLQPCFKGLLRLQNSAVVVKNPVQGCQNTPRFVEYFVTLHTMKCHFFGSCVSSLSIYNHCLNHCLNETKTFNDVLSDKMLHGFGVFSQPCSSRSSFARPAVPLHYILIIFLYLLINISTRSFMLFIQQSGRFGYIRNNWNSHSKVSFNFLLYYFPSIQC